MFYRFTNDEFGKISHLIRHTASTIREQIAVSYNSISVTSFSLSGLTTLSENESLRFPPLLLDSLFPRKGATEEVTNASYWLRAFMMVERIRYLYSSLGCLKQPSLTQYAKYIIYWYILYKNKLAEKVAKFQSVSAFNELQNVEPLEDINLPFGWRRGRLGFGVFREYERYLFRHFSSFGRRKRFRLSQCYLYFKKGCPPVTPDFIGETLVKHQKTLTSNRKIKVPIDCLNKGVLREVLKERCRAICSEVLKDYKGPDKLWDPSLNATFSNPRSEGGQFGDLTCIKRCGFLCNFSGEYECRCGDYGFYFNGKTVVKVPGQNCLKLDLVPIRRELMSMRARPVALTEPLKVRTITCEMPNVTWLFKGLQMSLWKCLKEHPTFALVGRPVSASDIFIGDGDYLSVDYSAATDNFTCEFTKIVTKCLSEVIGLPYKIVLATLNNHILDYSSCDGLPEEMRVEVRQSTGQLMGSILSFIVLCLGNATICSLAIKENEFKTLRELPLLINGDDGLMLSDDRVYSLWKSWSNCVGLDPSIGKVYKSPNFAVINSQLFYKSKSGLIRDCPYPNCNFLQYYDGRTFAQPKTPLDLASAQKGLHEGFKTYEEKRRVDDLFFREFNWLLKCRELKDVSWYLDQSLGGLGLDPSFRNFSFELTKPQIARIAKALRGEPLFTKALPLKRTMNILSKFKPVRQDRLCLAWNRKNLLQIQHEKQQGRLEAQKENAQEMSNPDKFCPNPLQPRSNYLFNLFHTASQQMTDGSLQEHSSRQPLMTIVDQLCGHYALQRLSSAEVQQCELGMPWDRKDVRQSVTSGGVNFIAMTSIAGVSTLLPSYKKDMEQANAFSCEQLHSTVLPKINKSLLTRLHKRATSAHSTIGPPVKGLSEKDYALGRTLQNMERSFHFWSRICVTTVASNASQPFSIKFSQLGHGSYCHTMDLLNTMREGNSVSQMLPIYMQHSQDTPYAWAQSKSTSLQETSRMLFNQWLTLGSQLVGELLH